MNDIIIITLRCVECSSTRMPIRAKTMSRICFHEFRFRFFSLVSTNLCINGFGTRNMGLAFLFSHFLCGFWWRWRRRKSPGRQYYYWIFVLFSMCMRFGSVWSPFFQRTQILVVSLSVCIITNANNRNVEMSMFEFGVQEVASNLFCLSIYEGICGWLPRHWQMNGT